jgi:hypothetical protein
MSRLAAIALLRAAADLVRRAEGELVSDRGITEEQLQELTQEIRDVSLDRLANSVQAKTRRRRTGED